MTIAPSNKRASGALAGFTGFTNIVRPRPPLISGGFLRCGASVAGVLHGTRGKEAPCVSMGRPSRAPDPAKILRSSAPAEWRGLWRFADEKSQDRGASSVSVRRTNIVILPLITESSLAFSPLGACVAIYHAPATGSRRLSQVRRVSPRKPGQEKPRAESKQRQRAWLWNGVQGKSILGIHQLKPRAVPDNQSGDRVKVAATGAEREDIEHVAARRPKAIEEGDFERPGQIRVTGDLKDVEVAWFCPGYFQEEQAVIALDIVAVEDEVPKGRAGADFCTRVAQIGRNGSRPGYSAATKVHTV